MRFTKTFTAAIAALSLLSCVLPASAIQQLIKSGATTKVPFLLTDSATGQTGQTGLVLGTGYTVTVKLPGASSFVAASGSAVEIGNGDYEYVPTTAETGGGTTTGNLLLHISGTGLSTQDVAAQVVAFDPNNAVNMGLTNLDATVSSRMATFTLPGNFSALAVTGGGAVTAGTVSDKAGYSLVTAPPTTAQIVTAVKSDAQFALLLNARKGLYNYVPGTKTLTLLNDDGTSTGLTVVLTVDGTGQITARH